MNKNKGVYELLFGLIDKLVGSEESKTFKVFLALIIVTGVFMIYKGDIVKDYFVESKYATYLENERVSMENGLPQVSKHALQVIRLSSGADIVMFNRYKPEESMMFYDVFSFEGTTPNGIDMKDISHNNPINKTTTEYNFHMAGLSYRGTDGDNSFVPFDVNDDSIYYSCPVFDLDNIYAGSIVMIWYRNTDNLSSVNMLGKRSEDEKMFSICNHGARIIGRSFK